MSTTSRPYIRPGGPPLSCGLFRDVPCWFDGDGWPHSLEALQLAQAVTITRRADLVAALTELDRVIQERAAIITRLEALEASGA